LRNPWQAPAMASMSPKEEWELLAAWPFHPLMKRHAPATASMSPQEEWEPLAAWPLHPLMKRTVELRHL